MRQHNGLTWDDLERVLGEAPDWESEDRFASMGWSGPAGQCWRFWQLVWELRRQRLGFR